MPRRRIWLRAALTASAVVALFLVGPVLLSGFLPDAPILRNLSRLVVPWLPWLFLFAALSCTAALLATRIGDAGLGHRAVAIVGILAFVGANVLAVRVVAFSISTGTQLSLSRLAGLAGTPMPTADSEIVFATIDGTPLRAQIWQVSTTPRALALFVHGGAFTGGRLAERPWLLRALADQGLAVMDVEYRLAPPARWDVAPGDVLCALGWLEAHAADLGGDPRRIVVIGDSAGGNLGLMAAYGAGTDQMQSSCGTPASPPAAVVAIEPAADLAAIWKDGSEPDRIGTGTFPEAYIGGTPEQYPDRYAAASPMRLIRKGIPPTFLIAAENDHLILPARTHELASRIAAAGAMCWIVTVPFAEHGIAFGPDDYGAQALEAVIPLFAWSTLDGGAVIGKPCT